MSIRKQQSRPFQYWEWATDNIGDSQSTVPMDGSELLPVVENVQRQCKMNREEYNNPPCGAVQQHGWPSHVQPVPRAYVEIKRPVSTLQGLYYFMGIVSVIFTLLGGVLGVVGMQHNWFDSLLSAESSQAQSSPHRQTTLSPLSLSSDWQQAGLTSSDAEEARVWSVTFVERYQTVDGTIPASFQSAPTFMTRAAQERFRTSDIRVTQGFEQQLRQGQERRVALPDTFHVQLLQAQQSNGLFFAWFAVPFALQDQVGNKPPDVSYHSIAVLVVHLATPSDIAGGLRWRVSNYTSDYQVGEALPVILDQP